MPHNKKKSLNDRIREADESTVWFDVQMLFSSILIGAALMCLALYLKP